MKILAATILAQILVVQGAVSQQITYKELSTMQKVAPTGVKYGSYISKDGSLYQITGRIKYGVPRAGGAFTFIWRGDAIMTAITYAPASMANIETEITGIEITGNNKLGFRILLKTKPIGYGINYKIDLENALEVGEVKRFGMSSDEALAELKKAKDKLDLGLITQAKYDSIKTVLAKYIN